MFLGFGFDGDRCVGISGCGCGELCDAIYPTMEACAEGCADELNLCVADGGFCAGYDFLDGGAGLAPPAPLPECPPGSAEVDLSGCGAWEICCFETCVPEGGSGGIYPGAPSCCEGLVSIPCGGAIDGVCEPCDGGFSCTACGDGVCDAPENECTCPEDCAVPSCVPEGGSGGVYPGAPSCCEGLVSIPCGGPVDGVCEPCVGGFSCTACGDGVCDAPENQCTCPDDC